MRREEKRVRGGVAKSIRASAPRIGTSFAGSPRAERGYRSTPGLLKYGLAGRAIITIAIATPANKDRTSIILTHLRACGSCGRSNSARFQVDCPSARRAALANRRCARGETRASVRKFSRERCGEADRRRFYSREIGSFPCVLCDASLLTGSRTKERCTPG